MSDEQGYNLKSRPGGHLHLLESIVDNANDSILITEAEPIDKPGPRIVLINESFTRTTGYALEEVIGKTPRILQGPKTDRAQLDKIRAALSKDESVRVELLNYRKNGAEFWVEINIVPIVDEHGRITHYVSIQREITERKQTEQKLRRTSRDLTTIFESITDAFFSVDREWRFTYLNSEAERVLERKRDDLVGKSIWEEFQEAVGLKFYQQYNKAVDEQRTVEFEEIYPSLETWFEVKAYPSEAGLSVYFRDINERKRMEKELRESEERLRTILVQYSSDIITILEADGSIRYESPAVEQVLGYKSDELIGKNILDYVYPEDVEGAVKELGTIRRSSEVRGPVEVRFRHKDGSWRWIEGIANNLLGDPDVGGVVINSRDITGRKQAERRLADAEERYRTLVEQMPAIIYIHEPTPANQSATYDYEVSYISPRVEKVLGYKSQEFVNNRALWNEIIHPDDRAEVLAEDERTDESGDPFLMEYRMVCRDDRVVWIREEALLIRSPEGEPIYWQGVMIDVTARKQAEEQLREVEARFRSAFNDVAVGMALTDPESQRYLQVNQAWCNMLGYSEEELLATTFLELTHPEDLEATTDYTQRLVAREIDSYQHEKRYVRADGYVVWSLTSVSVVRNAENHPLYFVAQMQEVTERKRVEENYRAIFENAVEGIYRTAPEGDLIGANPALSRIFGYDSPEEMITALEDVERNYVDPERQEEFARVMRETGRVSGFEYRAYRKDGSIVWVSDSARVIRDAESGLPYYEGFIQDITERKLAEEEVKESLDLLQSVMEGTTDAVFVKNLQGRYLMINQAGAEALGKSAGEVVGKDDTELFEYEDGREVMEADRETMTTGETRTTEDTKTADGVTRTFLVTKGPYRDARGSITGMFGVAREITERKSAEEALRRSEGSLAAAQRIAHVGNWKWVIGQDLYWSDELYRIYGFTPQQFAPTYEDFIRAIHPDDREYIEKTQEEVRRSRERPTIECRIVRPDGEARIVQNSFEMNYDETGNLTRIAGTVQDITERKWDERRRRVQHDVTRIMAEASTLEDAAPEILRAICEGLQWEVGGFWNVDREAGVLRCIQTWNVPTIDVSAFVEITHEMTFSRGEGLPGQIWESGKPAWIPDVWDADSFPRMPLAMKEGLHGGFGFPVLLEGKVLGVMDFFSRAVRQLDEEVLDMMTAIGSQVGQFIQRKGFEEQLQHQALHDDLTDLPNRTLFADRLRHALERVKRRKKSVAVLFLDLDNFKYVNDTLGHDIGDRLLITAAERLTECLRPDDTAARLGGDEFAVLLEEVVEPSEAERVAKRILHALSSPFDLEGHRQFTSASVGIVIKYGSDSSPGDLLRSADLAMYKAKAAGKNRYAIFDPETARRSMERLELENDLRSALERDEFKVYYQPLVLLRTRQVVGIEALARWEHPRRGLVTPCEFIPVAEEIGLIVHIGARVLHEACRQARRWQESYLYSPPLIVGVNLSVRQLQNADLVGSVEKTLRETGLEPESLTLEVTESAFVDDAEDHIATLRRLRGLGIRIAIDDFGVGYSSLSYLRRLPAGLLKIDGSFVERITEAAEDKVLLRGAIDIAHGLGLRVAAEGVETAEQVALLESLGCDLAQGRYFSDALPAEQTEALLAQQVPFVE